jgi:hypothetical protein
VPHAFWPLLFALALAGSTTLVLVVALGVFKPQARYLVPVGGMVIGNAMTAAAVALNRLGDDVADGAVQIEATLALGATASQAMRPFLRRSLRSGMIPLIDSTETTGLIFFPGTMVGMLLAGASPINAVRLHPVLLFVLLGSVALAALTAVFVADRNFCCANFPGRPFDRTSRSSRIESVGTIGLVRRSGPTRALIASSRLLEVWSFLASFRSWSLVPTPQSLIGTKFLVAGRDCCFRRPLC